jgi:hypothetical protein
MDPIMNTSGLPGGLSCLVSLERPVLPVMAMSKQNAFINTFFDALNRT